MKRTILLLLIGATCGAYAQNLAWDYDSFGWLIVLLPAAPVATATVWCYRRVA